MAGGLNAVWSVSWSSKKRWPSTVTFHEGMDVAVGHGDAGSGEVGTGTSVGKSGRAQRWRASWGSFNGWIHSRKKRMEGASRCAGIGALWRRSGFVPVPGEAWSSGGKFWNRGLARLRA